jgi:HEAT repeat protein
LLATSQHDIDAHVRKAAIDALGKIGAPEAYEPLVELMNIEKYIDIIEKIVEALIHIDKVRFLSGLASYTRIIKKAAAQIITDAEALLSLTQDEDRNVKFAAIQGLGRIGTSEALDRLSMFIMDPDPEIRKIAIMAMGDARCCSPELLQHLTDSDPWVRFYTVKAVFQACDPETALQQIEPILADTFIPVVMAALDIIRDIGGQAAYELLDRYREHPNEDVRAKIEEVLSNI